MQFIYLFFSLLIKVKKNAKNTKISKNTYINLEILNYKLFY